MKKKKIQQILQQLEELKVILQTLTNTPTEEVFLDSTQMLQLLRCSESTLYRLRNKGIIPCIRIGGQYRYPRNYFTKEVLDTISKKEDPSKRFDD